jgi:serine/threonine protein kinase
MKEVDACEAYCTMKMTQGSELPVMMHTGSSGRAQEVSIRILKKLGSGSFSVVYQVLVAGKLYAMKVFTHRNKVRTCATVQPDIAQTSKQQQQHSDLQCIGTELQGNASNAEQENQLQQPGEVLRQGSVQQKASASQHDCRAPSGSIGSGTSREVEELQAGSLAVSESGATELPSYLQGMPDALQQLRMSRDIELQYMLVARGDPRTACIVAGTESTLWPAATPESELCPHVVAVHGWGHFTMQYKEFQAPVLLMELAATSLSKLLRAVNVANRCTPGGQRLIGFMQEEARFLTKQVVEALASAHNAHMLCDLKTGEVQLCGPRTPSRRCAAHLCT